MAGPTGPKGAMRGGIRRQGDDMLQVRVYNSAARRREYFTVTGTLKDARDARNRCVAQITEGSKPPPRGASKVTIRELVPLLRVETLSIDAPTIPGEGRGVLALAIAVVG